MVKRPGRQYSQPACCPEECPVVSDTSTGSIHTLLATLIPTFRSQLGADGSHGRGQEDGFDQQLNKVLDLSHLGHSSMQRYAEA